MDLSYFLSKHTFLLLLTNVPKEDTQGIKKVASLFKGPIDAR